MLYCFFTKTRKMKNSETIEIAIHLGTCPFLTRQSNIIKHIRDIIVL